MKDILIISHFTQAPNETGNGRFHYIATELAKKKDCSVEIVTTSFSHRLKTQRKISQSEMNRLNYKFTMVKEPGYKKNVCIQRFYSHYLFGKNLKKYLEKRKVPSIIYCSIPSLDAAKVAAEYASKNQVKFIIDIQDIWPEAFKMVFNIPIISDIIFAPMMHKANFAYKQADKIVAVSKTYVNRALSVNSKCTEGKSVFLGTELIEFDKNNLGKKISEMSDEIWLVYVGTLGHSYDLTSVFDSMKILKDKGYSNIHFRVMGTGPLRQKFEQYKKKLDISVEFTGALPYPEMVRKLCECDIAVNPIMHGAAQSIINKVGDYAMAGIPVISTQECPEYRNLIKEYGCGFNCINNDSNDISDKLEQLIKHPELRKKMGYKNRLLGKEKFNRETTYQTIFSEMIGN